MSKSKMQKAIERQKEIVMQRADLMMSDTSHDWLRTPMAQRLVVLFYLGSATVMTFLWLSTPIIFGLLATLATLVGLIALRSSVRTQADLPDYVLDERQLEERNECYVNAFRLVSGALFTFTAIALGVTILKEPSQGYIRIGYTEANAIFWAVAALVAGAPSMALAMRQSSRRARAKYLDC
jgi:hypothetical protein